MTTDPTNRRASSAVAAIVAIIVVAVAALMGLFTIRGVVVV